MKRRTRIIYGLALALAFGIAFFIRVYFPHDNVFAGDWVRFQINDPWYHMRQVENLVHHFPQRSLFDPYGFFPDGQSMAAAPFFDLLLGSVIWVIGLGSPSKTLIDSAGAYFPAILGALITIPVYFIGKELFSRTAGLLAAFLIAILPGEFLMRSLLGFTDHHAAEVLFSTITILFLILAMKSSREKEISFNSLRSRDWGTLGKPLIYTVLTGLALGVYLLSWTGSALFVFIILAFAIVQYIIDHLRGRTTDYLFITGALPFLIALLMILPAYGNYSFGNIQVTSLVIGLLAFLALSGFSFLMVRKNIRQAYYPIALVAMGAIGLLLFYILAPSLLNSMLRVLNVLSPSVGMQTVAEVKGLSLTATWDHFTTDFYISLVALVAIAYMVIKEGAPDKTLLLVWSIILLIATFDLWLTDGQRRFAYYFAVNIAILTAYLSWKVLQLAGFREPTTEPQQEQAENDVKLQSEMMKSTSRKKSKQKDTKPQKKEGRTPSTGPSITRIALGSIAVIVVFFGAFYPNIGKAIEWAEGVRGPNDDWHDSLVWLEENTPEPFLDDDFYYELYEVPANKWNYDYPESAYGIMSWWDYGYHITYIAHRIPNANPAGSRGAKNAGLFFTAPDEAEASTVLDKVGSQYVIIDYPMAMPLLKYHAMIKWSDQNEGAFYDVYYESQGAQLIPTMLYHPAYYQSMCSRLYNFGGEEWTPYEVSVIHPTTREVTDVDGNDLTVKVISDEKTFSTYDDAIAFIEANPGYIIVGTEPFISPVPLEKLEHYELIYKSPTTIITRGVEAFSHVEIFKYNPQ